MDKYKVIKILEFYKRINDSISYNKKIIFSLEEEYYNCAGSINLDGMPKAVGKISKPTESKGLEMLDSYVSEHIKEIYQENDYLKNLKEEILKEIYKLPYIYKRVILEFYINDMKWEQVSEQIGYSTRQCKNIRSYAIKKLTYQFEKNKVINVISEFNFFI
ncbi:MAG: sigma-70 family RNA polymerase sigma factor [Lachnospiraceae bacterium]|nr:sigma-70 family RNA polymerase sigma factor [Lachnospiraceae bacterium]